MIGNEFTYPQKREPAMRQRAFVRHLTILFVVFSSIVAFKNEVVETSNSLTNNINPNIYRFLRQRGVLTTIIISYEIRTICFERVSVANWNHSKDATVRSVTSERERNLTKHASTERQSSFVLGRSTTFTNAIPRILLCSHSLTTLHGNLFLKATFN